MRWRRPRRERTGDKPNRGGQAARGDELADAGQQLRRIVGQVRQHRRFASVVVVFHLMPHCRNHHIGWVDDLEKCNIARVPERDDRFPQERTLAGVAAGEGRCFQSGNTRTDGGDGLLGQCQVTTGSRKLRFEGEVEKLLQVGLRLIGTTCWVVEWMSRSWSAAATAGRIARARRSATLSWPPSSHSTDQMRLRLSVGVDFIPFVARLL